MRDGEVDQQCNMVQLQPMNENPYPSTHRLLQENAPWNLNFETRHEPELYYGQWPGHTYNPSPPDWRSLVIYQQLGLDRFGFG